MAQIEPGFVVKVCGITEESDARAALEAGANALGFNFYPRSPRFITPQQASQIVQKVPGDYLRVGVFVNASETQLMSVCGEVPLDVLQLHGNDCMLPSGYRIWRAVRGDEAAPPADTRIEAYLLDAPTPLYGGSGHTFDWSRAKAFPHRAIVAGGLDGSNVASAIEALLPWGVDACSRIEARPGHKDIERMRAFVRSALAAGESLHSQEISFL